MGKDRVKDHCHFSGTFRGAAHNKCNINFNNKYFKIPVFFHNLKGYDAHLIIQELNKFPDVRFSGIPQNTEKFISFSFNNLVFKDSLGFLPASLDSLVFLALNIPMGS